MADRITSNFRITTMIWWPLIYLTWNLSQFVYGAPLAQTGLLENIPQWPQFINYLPFVRNFSLPGGQQKSLLEPKFEPNEVVVSSGISDPLNSGVAGGFDFLGRSIFSAGEALASTVSSLFTGRFSVSLKSSGIKNYNKIIFRNNSQCNGDCQWYIRSGASK